MTSLRASRDMYDILYVCVSSVSTWLCSRLYLVIIRPLCCSLLDEWNWKADSFLDFDCRSHGIVGPNLYASLVRWGVGGMNTVIVSNYQALQRWSDINELFQSSKGVSFDLGAYHFSTWMIVSLQVIIQSKQSWSITESVCRVVSVPLPPHAAYLIPK